MTLTNLTAAPVDERFLNKITAKTLQTVKRKGDVSVVLVGAGRMRELNRRYRGKNRVTDVLAFSYAAPSAPRTRADSTLAHADRDAEETMLLGEIVMCLPVAKKQARHAGHSFERELATLLIHGILHVCGYDHERSEKDAEIMFGLQEKVLHRVKSEARNPKSETNSKS